MSEKMENRGISFSNGEKIRRKSSFKRIISAKGIVVENIDES